MKKTSRWLRRRAQRSAAGAHSFALKKEHLRWKSDAALAALLMRLTRPQGGRA